MEKAQTQKQKLRKEYLVMEEELKNLIKQAVKEALEELHNKHPQEILSVKQLCKWLGVSPAWISENKDKLNIPYFKMGGDKFYRSDIEKWIEENKNDIRVCRELAVPKTTIKVTKSKYKVS